jgi:hypothetical protein
MNTQNTLNRIPRVVVGIVTALWIVTVLAGRHSALGLSDRTAFIILLVAGITMCTTSWQCHRCCDPAPGRGCFCWLAPARSSQRPGSLPHPGSPGSPKSIPKSATRPVHSPPTCQSGLITMDTPYRLQVKGQLPTGWSEWLGQFEITCEPDGNTTLTGSVRDQSELYGLVAKLQNLGLTLLSMNPVTETHEAETS